MRQIFKHTPPSSGKKMNGGKCRDIVDEAKPQKVFSIFIQNAQNEVSVINLSGIIQGPYCALISTKGSSH